MAAPAPTAAVTVCRQFVAFTTVIFFLVDRQCHSFQVAAARASPDVTWERNTLQADHQHPWKYMKSGAAENFGFVAVNVGAISGKNRTTLGFRKGRARRKVTSRLEVEALTSFKAAITHDPLGALDGWHANDSDACGWTGVECSLQEPKHLIALNIGGDQLAGNLNSALQELGKLPFLQRLDLSSNAFTGSIPAAALVNCTNLSYLNFSSNQLKGEIPAAIGELVNLQTLDFGENNLTGVIPVSLGNCTSLRILALGSNFLQGEIPATLGRLSGLEYLALNAYSIVPSNIIAHPLTFNSLSGSIPPELGNCSSLVHLSTTYNANLGGELPPELSQLKRMQHFAVSFCNFEGAIPTWLWNLASLTVVSLSYNQFHGEIPDGMGQIRALEFLALGGNNFTGAIPISLTNCTGLTELGLEDNALSGNILPQLGLLRNLVVLFLGQNTFTGVIPSAISNCSALVSLQFGDNLFLIHNPYRHG